MGRDLEIGSARLRVVKMIQRCAATQVDPETAARDIDVPDALYRLTGEDDCGIYAEVIAAGRIAEGDPIKIIAEAYSAGPSGFGGLTSPAGCARAAGAA